MIYKRRAAAAALITALLASFFAYTYAPSAEANASASESPEVYIITLEDGADRAGVVSAALAAAGGGAEIGYSYSLLFSGFSMTAPPSAIYAIRDIDGVKSAERSVIYDCVPLAEAGDGESVSAANAEEAGAGDGAGMVVAVLDSGFVTSGRLFRLTDPSTAAIRLTDVTALTGRLNASGKVYMSDKIPLAYDYINKKTGVAPDKTDDPAAASHGTHVASAIAANGKYSASGYTGIAPEAQILMMKVFGDDGGARDADICAAVEDALLLGADVINISAGVPAGFSGGEPFGFDLSAALEGASGRGALVVCAAGNSARSGANSYYDIEYAISHPEAAFPDYGTVASPASIPSAVAVGALTNPLVKAFCFEHSGEKIRYTDTCYEYVEPIGHDFSFRFDGESFEFVVVPGLGSAEDFYALGEGALDGKIALIERGELTFAEKINNAAAVGAAAAIIYNNEDAEQPLVNMDLTGALLPAIFIAREDGVKLIESEDKVVSFAKGDAAMFPNTEPRSPAAFSSWGVTPDLKLKPDVSAVGAGVSAAVSDSELAEMSGTSMSAATVTGAVLKIKRYLAERKLDASPAAVKAFMMNTALPLENAGGVPYSPRAQGAGEVTASTPKSEVGVILTAKNGEAKLELGDRLKNEFKLEFTLKNLTDRPITAEIAASLATDSLISYTGDDHSVLPLFADGEPGVIGDAKIMLGDTDINAFPAGENGGASVTVAAGSEKTVTLNVIIAPDSFAEYAGEFPNGFFAEGFIWASYEGGETVSIPYVGFCGDWAAAPIFDKTIYDGGGFYRSTLLFAIIGGKSFFTQQMTVLGGEDADAALAAFSPGTDGNADTVALTLDMLRSARDFTYSVYDKSGALIYYAGQKDFIRKNRAAGGAFYNYEFVLWDGRDEGNPNYIYPDGIYRIIISATPDYDGAKPQTLAFDVYLDTERPIIESFDINADENGARTLTAHFSDNHAVKNVTLYESVGDAVTAFEAAFVGEASEAAFNITEYKRRYVYIDIEDYAFNVSTYRVEINAPSDENAG